jgi:hypothetical protein
VQWGVAGAGWFETMRVPIVLGRAFTTEDRAGSTGVAVVNQTLARRLWAGENPLGRWFKLGERVVQVVGVAKDGKYAGLHEAPVGYAWQPLEQAYMSSVTIHARAKGGDVHAALVALRREWAALDPDVAMQRAGPLQRELDSFSLAERFAAPTLGLFGLTGLALAALGLYGILAYQVTTRAREFGVRLALGAQGRDLVTLVLRHSVKLFVTGLVIGAAGAYVLARVVSGFLHGVAPIDPVTWLVVSAVLGAVTLLASWLPANRAARVDPRLSLRAE